MQQPKTLGLGGVFVRAKDPAALRTWYAEHLGLDLDPAWNGGALEAKDGDVTVFSLFAPDTDHLGDRGQRVMLNWRVSDLDAMLAWLRHKGARVDDKTERSDYGYFGWAWDGEGNRFELWQPPAA